MTEQQPLNGRDGPMELNEGALKERFETAVSGVSPDVTALMNGGMQQGEQLRRRRRAEVFGAAGLSAAAAAAIVYSGFASDMFDSNSTGPTDTTHIPVERINSSATARSLTAAALAHLPADDKVIAAGSMGGPAHGSAIFASVGLGTAQGKVQLDLIATTRVKGWDRQNPCALGAPQTASVQCHKSTLVSGGQLVVAAERIGAGPGPVRYMVRVTVRRDTQLVGVLESVTARQVTPQQGNTTLASWRFPVPVAALRGIVTDPRFGVMTSREMLAKGRALDNFSSDMGASTSHSSSAVRVSPQRGASAPQAPAQNVAPGKSSSSSSGGASAPAPTQRPRTSPPSARP